VSAKATNDQGDDRATGDERRRATSDDECERRRATTSALTCQRSLKRRCVDRNDSVRLAGHFKQEPTCSSRSSRARPSSVPIASMYAACRRRITMRCSGVGVGRDAMCAYSVSTTSCSCQKANTFLEPSRKKSKHFPQTAHPSIWLISIFLIPSFSYYYYYYSF